MELWRAAGLQDKKDIQNQKNNSYLMETRHKLETWTEEDNGKQGPKQGHMPQGTCVEKVRRFQ